MLLHTLLMCHDVFWDTGREPMQNNTHSLMKERLNLNTCCALLMCYLPEQDRRTILDAAGEDVTYKVVVMALANTTNKTPLHNPA